MLLRAFSKVAHRSITYIQIKSNSRKDWHIWKTPGVHPRSKINRFITNHLEPFAGGVPDPFLEDSFLKVGRSEIMEEFDSVFPTGFGNPICSTKSVNQGVLMFLLTKR